MGRAGRDPSINVEAIMLVEKSVFTIQNKRKKKGDIDKSKSKGKKTTTLSLASELLGLASDDESASSSSSSVEEEVETPEQAEDETLLARSIRILLKIHPL